MNQLPRKHPNDVRPTPRDSSNELVFRKNGGNRLTTGDTNNCPFCRIINTNQRFLQPHDQIILETEHFFVVAGVGQIIEGYLLICTKIHISNFLAIPNELFIEYQVLKNKVRQLLMQGYKVNPIFFEHGLGRSLNNGGSCIDHAHIHVFPIQMKSSDIPGIKEMWKNLESYRYIQQLIKPSEGYLLFEFSDNEMLIYKDLLIPSQLGRKLVARYIQKADEWDWAVFPYFNRMQSTIARLNSQMCGGKECL